MAAARCSRTSLRRRANTGTRRRETRCTVRYGAVRCVHGTVRYDTIRYGTVQCVHAVCKVHGAVCARRVQRARCTVQCVHGARCAAAVVTLHLQWKMEREGTRRPLCGYQDSALRGLLNFGCAIIPCWLSDMATCMHSFVHLSGACSGTLASEISVPQ